MAAPGFEPGSHVPKTRILTWLNYTAMNTLDRCYANVAEFPSVLLQDTDNRRASKFLHAGCQTGSQSYLLFDYGWLRPSPPPKCCLLPRNFAAIVFILVFAATKLRMRYFLQHLLEFPPLLLCAVCIIIRILFQTIHITILF